MTDIPESPAADPAPPPRGRPSWLWIAGGALVAIAIAVVLVVVMKTGKTSKPSALNLGAPAQGPIVSAGGRQLVSMLEAGGKVTFHATYNVIGAAAAQGGLTSLEIWQRDGRRREDTVIKGGGHVDRTASITSGSTVRTCIQVDNGGWTCRQSDVDPNNLLATVVGSVGNQSVGVSTATMHGTKVTCFQVGATQTGLQLCASGDGIPVRIATPSAAYELASRSSNVDSSIFNVP